MEFRVISWIIVFHVEPHRRAALGKLGISGLEVQRDRGIRGIEGIEVFSKEKPFREVSCNFVDYRIPRRSAPPCGFGGIGDFRISGFQEISGYISTKKRDVVTSCCYVSTCCLVVLLTCSLILMYELRDLNGV